MFQGNRSLLQQYAGKLRCLLEYVLSEPLHARLPLNETCLTSVSQRLVDIAREGHHSGLGRQPAHSKILVILQDMDINCACSSGAVMLPQQYMTGGSGRDSAVSLGPLFPGQNLTCQSGAPYQFLQE